MSEIRISKTLILLFLALCLSLDAYQTEPDTSRIIDQEIARLKDEIIKTRRFIHMNPELGNREFETGRLVASKLMALGFDVRTGVPFQSLNPGVMHACGHDIHTTVVLGTAMVMHSLKNRLKGNIKFIFQPAEEGPPQGEEGGAELMIEEGVLENPPLSAIFGLHVMPFDVGRIQFSPGAIMASPTWFEIIIKGQSAHGARPHEGKDAIALAAQVILSIQTIVSRNIDATDPAVVSIGKIEGGSRSNIVAEEVRLEGTIRTLSETNRETILNQMENVIKGITHAFGADYTFRYSGSTPPLYNHPELSKVMLPYLFRVVGESFVDPVVPLMVSEDFACFCQKIPCFFFFLGVKPPESDKIAPLHSPEFNPDERSIPLGIRVMSHLLFHALEYQNHSENPS